MKQKSSPQENTKLDGMLENATDKKNAWIKIILELEKAENIRKALLNNEGKNLGK